MNIILFNYNFQIAKKINLFDIPNSPRKIHTQPTPLNGGIFYFINLLLIFFCDYFLNESKIRIFFGFLNEIDFILFIFSLSCILFIGILDDKLSLKPSSKIILSTTVFLIFLISVEHYQIRELRFQTNLFVIDLFNLSLIFSIICFLTLQIILNMYDGINLQSSIYYSTIFTIILIYNQNLQIQIFVLFSIIYLIFFSFNNFKNKLFMGDNGVYVFSFIIYIILIHTYKSSPTLKVEHIFLILLFPFIDMLRLFFVRINKNRNPLNADRSHLHHLLFKKYKLINVNLILICPLIIAMTLILFSKIYVTYLLILNLIIYFFLVRLK